MERFQGGHTFSCEGVHELLVEQVLVHTSYRFLQPFPILEQKWDTISMDFITRLPKVKGKDCIYVVVDKLTKYSQLFTIPTEYNTFQVANLVFREVSRLHGLPRNIVNDQDNEFLSVFW
jgi:hypothetical protein